MNITWSLAYGSGQQQIKEDKQYMWNTGNFKHHTDVMVHCGVHCTMEHIPGFTRSHCMPPLGKCLRQFAPTAAMVDKFVEIHKTLTKHNFYSAIIVLFILKHSVTFGTQNRPSTRHIKTTSCVKMWDSTIWAEELHRHFYLSNIASRQKFKKLLALNEACQKSWCIYVPIAVKSC